MNQRQKDIFQFLQSNGQRWVTGKELAAFIDITPRSIRSNIAKMNEEQAGVVESSQDGYRLSEGSSEKQAVSDERISKLFLLLLKHSTRGISIYDLTQALMVSDSTLRNDISDLRQRLPNGSLKITVNQNTVHLAGSERAKRKYMISLLYSEGDFREQLKLSVQNMIGYISLNELENIVQTTLKSQGIQLNTYSLYNIALHLAISIERIRQGHSMKIAPQNDIQDTSAYVIGNAVADAVEQRYGIHFNTPECQYLALLFIGMTTDANQTGTFADYIDQRTLTVLKEVLKKVEQVYHVDLTDQDFFEKLAVHVQCLRYRAEYDTFERNSNLQEIKASYPLIYDISVYISSLLQEKLKISFNDDEISFIALHLGALFESRRVADQTIRVGLITAQYHNLDSLLKEKLSSALGKKIEIVDAADSSFHQVDVLLTTSRRTARNNSGSVFIHTFPTAEDLLKVENRLLALRRVKQNQQIFTYIDRFVIRDLYFNQIDSAGLTPALIRADMVKRMVHYGYVSDTYLTNVEKREKMSPTSFPSGVAVPHSIELDGIRSGISVMTLQEPIQWANYAIRMVVLVAVNPEESQAYNTFFERLIDILSDSVNTKQLSGVEGFDEFILKLKAMVTTQEE
ncbi:MAG: PRD domain-containing protein [Schleiferilactobacillus harbinensis]|jgi:lichenan operon transcriptional antiterminator|nr:PRD domain-containing protein [Schleiferilactobacillus harbinensis]